MPKHTEAGGHGLVERHLWECDQCGSLISGAPAGGNCPACERGHVKPVTAYLPASPHQVVGAASEKQIDTLISLGACTCIWDAAEHDEMDKANADGDVIRTPDPCCVLHRIFRSALSQGEGGNE